MGECCSEAHGVSLSRASSADMPPHLNTLPIPCEQSSSMYQSAKGHCSGDAPGVCGLPVDQGGYGARTASTSLDDDTPLPVG